MGEILMSSEGLYDLIATGGQIKRILEMMREIKLGDEGIDDLIETGHLEVLLEAAKQGLLTTLKPIRGPERSSERSYCPASMQGGLRILNLIGEKGVGMNGISDLIMTGHLPAMFRAAGAGDLASLPLLKFRDPLREIPEEVFLSVEYGKTWNEMVKDAYLYNFDARLITSQTYPIGCGQGTVTRRVKLVQYRHTHSRKNYLGIGGIETDLGERGLSVPGFEWLLSFVRFYPEICPRFQCDIYALGAEEKGTEFPSGILFQKNDCNYRRYIQKNWAGNISSLGNDIFLGLVNE